MFATVLTIITTIWRPGFRVSISRVIPICTLDTFLGHPVCEPIMKLLQNNRINLCQTEIETSNNNLVAQYTLNNVSNHVSVSSSQNLMKSVLKQYFLCCPAICYEMLVAQQ